MMDDAADVLSPSPDKKGFVLRWPPSLARDALALATLGLSPKMFGVRRKSNVPSVRYAVGISAISRDSKRALMLT